MIQPATRDGAPTTAAFPGFAGALRLVLLVLILSAVAGLVGLAFKSQLAIEDTPIWFTLATYTFAMGGALAWYLHRIRLPFASAFQFGAFRPTILLAFVPLLVGAWILLIQSSAIMENLLPMPEWFLESLVRQIEEHPVVFGLFATTVVPALEEMLFRGAILRGFLDRYGCTVAVVASTFLFCVFHMNPWQFPAAFYIGLITGWAYVVTRSLWPCIAIHSVHNLTVSLIPWLGTILGPRDEHRDATSLPFLPWWLIGIGIALGLLGVFLIRREQQRHPVAPSEAPAA